MVAARLPESGFFLSLDKLALPEYYICKQVCMTNQFAKRRPNAKASDRCRTAREALLVQRRARRVGWRRDDPVDRVVFCRSGMAAGGFPWADFVAKQPHPPGHRWVA